MVKGIEVRHAFSGGQNEVVRQQKYNKMKQKYVPQTQNQSEIIDQQFQKVLNKDNNGTSSKQINNFQVSQSSPVLKQKEVFKF